MHYLIDGYNLLHQVGILLGRIPPGLLEAARLLLLRHLEQHQRLDPSVHHTVVFDASRSTNQRDSETSHHGIQVYFAHSGEADDLIEQLLARTSVPQQVTVVSDDRRLQEAARRRRCAVMTCLDYWEKAATRPREPLAPPTLDDTKPTTQSPDEVERWQKEFGQVEHEPTFEERFQDAEEEGF